jgi:ketopantoate hydroxymethyltransferase
MVKAFKAYDEEVKAKTFPDDEHSFQMKNEEALKRLY